VKRRAAERGLIAADAQLSDRQLLELLFLPGFSTKDKIDEVSGRGVGLDVIKTAAEALRGRVDITSEEGNGTCFALTVPLTLAFMEAMVVREQDRLFALPIEKVCEVFRPARRDVALNGADGELTIRVRDQFAPVLWLHRYYAPGSAPITANDVESLVERVIVAVQTSRGVLALPVDQLLGNQPIMLKPLSGLLADVRAAAGCGMLRNGDVALALDCERLHGA
jgi:two-component system chemotaxis sensor kinase CheA